MRIDNIHFKYGKTVTEFTVRTEVQQLKKLLVVKLKRHSIQGVDNAVTQIKFTHRHINPPFEYIHSNAVF